jgi:hypothetical protein
LHVSFRLFVFIPSLISFPPLFVFLCNILSRVGGYAWGIIRGSGSGDWIYWRLLCTVTLSYNQYSAIADLLLSSSPLYTH